MVPVMNCATHESHLMCDATVTALMQQWLGRQRLHAGVSGSTINNEIRLQGCHAVCETHAATFAQSAVTCGV